MITNAFWLALLISAVQLATTFANPSGDGAVEKAPFTSVKMTKNYEIRSYPMAKWVCKEHICPNFTVREQSDAFFSLHEYAMGKNSEDVKMSMTGPMTIKTVPDYDEEENSLFHMCMYLPKMYQETPPKPMEKGVRIQHRQPLTVAVCPFTSSMMVETNFMPHFDMLRSELAANNETNMDISDYYGATYDPPFKADGRRNEVWIVKKE